MWVSSKLFNVMRVLSRMPDALQGEDCPVSLATWDRINLFVLVDQAHSLRQSRGNVIELMVVISFNDELICDCNVSDRVSGYCHGINLA